MIKMGDPRRMVGRINRVMRALLTWLLTWCGTVDCRSKVGKVSARGWVHSDATVLLIRFMIV